jgi:hypothetical protein
MLPGWGKEVVAHNTEGATISIPHLRPFAFVCIGERGRQGLRCLMIELRKRKSTCSLRKGC